MQESACRETSGVANLRVESLSFADIPGQSRLFLDHLAQARSLSAYYPSLASSVEGIAGRAEAVIAKYPDHRAEICEILSDQNAGFDAAEPAMANIARLREPTTVAVLTGQQAGVFGGPLYTIYKALTAVKMAEQLTAAGTGAVPIFWAATEDHDFDEIATVFDVAHDGSLAVTEFPAGPEDLGKRVSDTLIPDDVRGLIGSHLSRLPPTEFSELTLGLLTEYWQPGVSYGTAFCRFIAKLFSGRGLIVVDPSDVRLKRLATPLILKAIENSDELATAMAARSADLVRDGYHAQVVIEDDHVPLFFHNEDGRRLALRQESADIFRVKSERTNFTRNELIAIANADPSALSPNVMLRPVVQDHLFPTVCYFGGGAEIAYFAQNSEVYRILERPATPIIHRQSFTIVEANRGRVLDKFGLSLADIFNGFESLAGDMIDRFVNPSTARLFADVEENINGELHKLDEELSRIDPTLAANLGTRRRKMLYHIAALQKKFHRVQAERSDVIGRQLRSALNELMPRDALQERTVSVVTFLNRHGAHFIDWVYDAIDLDCRAHRIIKL